MTENQMENLAATADQKDNAWEREVLEKLALAAVTEQRRVRRWGIFFKSLMFLYLFILLGVALYPKLESEISGSEEGHTAILEIKGMISEDSESSADSIIEGLREAVKNESTKGIILHLNSPGGTPVQAAYVYEAIRETKKKHPDLPIYAVVSDICASGCYYIGAAADKIYVSPASIVGSIGVLMDGFGFVGTLQKFGVERRLLTAGAHKAMLDPFSPVNAAENQHMQKLLDQVHKQFISAVREGRGDRLRETDDMFSGLVWTGEESIKLGLADAVGNDDYVAEKVIGYKKIVNFTPQQHFLDQLTGKLGTVFEHLISSSIRDWSMR